MLVLFESSLNVQPQLGTSLSSFFFFFFVPIFYSSLVCLSSPVLWVWLKDYLFHVIEGVNWKPLFLLKLPGYISYRKANWLIPDSNCFTCFSESIDK